VITDNPTPGTGGKKRISIVLPVYNGARYLDRVLAHIEASTFENYELIVVDDCSDDGSGDIVKRHRVDRYVRNDRRMEAGYSRNLGARLACGEILLFMDADILIARDTLQKIAAFFQGRQGKALIGLYSLEHPSGRISSQYKNSWIRFNYLSAPERVTWFFTAIGAVRKADWELVGGFDERLFSRTGGDDIEFGWRLIDRGVAIHMDKSLEVVHLKSYRLTELLKNDLQRAFGFSRLALSRICHPGRIMRGGVANISGAFAMAAPLAVFIFLLVPLMSTAPVLSLLFFPLFCLYLGLSGPFLKYVRGKYPLRRFLVFIPILFLDHLFCSAGICSALVAYPFHRLSKPPDVSKASQ
jgi:glycosyltransferase involved in cell wall biosynthesis